MERKPINKMKIWGITLCLIAAFSLMQGCIGDSLEECGLSVRITYTKNKDGVDRLAEKVNHVTLYVFDSDSVLIGAYPSNGPLYNGYAVPLSLLSGTYHFIVWGDVNDRNVTITPMVVGKTKVNEAQLFLNHAADFNKTVMNYQDSLYYGSQMGVKVRAALQESQLYQVIPVDLIKDTKKITVKAYGIDNLGGGDFACHINSLNAGLRFNNAIGSNDLVQYLPFSVRNVDEKMTECLVSEFTVLREIQDKSTRSELIFTRILNGVETELRVGRFNLVDLMLAYLAANRMWTWDIEDEYVIEIYFLDATYTSATVTINGWDYDTINETL